MNTKLKVAAEYAAFQAPIKTVPVQITAHEKISLLSSQVLESLMNTEKQATARFSTSFPINYSQIIQPRTLKRIANKAHARFQDGILSHLTARSKTVFPNRRTAARYQALASIIPGRER
jgi:hypothetical protein